MNMARKLWVFERPFLHGARGCVGRGGVWGDPHSDGEERGHGLWRILRSKAGVAPDSPATRQNGLSTVGRQSERTGSPLTYGSTTMECEIEAAIEWRVQEPALWSPSINGVSSLDIQAGLSSGSNAVPFLLSAKSIRDCRIHLHERRETKSERQRIGAIRYHLRRRSF